MRKCAFRWRDSAACLRSSLAIAMIAYQTRFWLRQAFPEQDMDKFVAGIGIRRTDIYRVRPAAPPAVVGQGGMSRAFLVERLRDDVLFIVVEYLPGGTFKRLIGSKGMEPERAE